MSRVRRKRKPPTRRDPTEAVLLLETWERLSRCEPLTDEQSRLAARELKRRLDDTKIDFGRPRGRGRSVQDWRFFVALDIAQRHARGRTVTEAEKDAVERFTGLTEAQVHRCWRDHRRAAKAFLARPKVETVDVERVIAWHTEGTVNRRR